MTFRTLGMLFKCPEVGCLYPGKMNEIYGVVLWPFIAPMDSDKFILWKNHAELLSLLQHIFHTRMYWSAESNYHLHVKPKHDWKFSYTHLF